MKEFLVQLLMYLPPVIGMFFIYRGMCKRFTDERTHRLPARAYIYIFLSFPVMMIVWNLFLIFITYLLGV